MFEIENSTKKDNQSPMKKLIQFNFPDEFKDIESIETIEVLVMNTNFNKGLETETIYHSVEQKTYEAFQKKFLMGKNEGEG